MGCCARSAELFIGGATRVGIEADIRAMVAELVDAAVADRWRR